MTAAESPRRPYTGTDMFYTDDSVAEMFCCEFCRQPLADQTLKSSDMCCTEFEFALRIDTLETALREILEAHNDHKMLRIARQALETLDE